MSQTEEADMVVFACRLHVQQPSTDTQEQKLWHKCVVQQDCQSFTTDNQAKRPSLLKTRTHGRSSNATDAGHIHSVIHLSQAYKNTLVQRTSSRVGLQVVRLTRLPGICSNIRTNTRRCHSSTPLTCQARNSMLDAAAPSQCCQPSCEACICSSTGATQPA